MNNMDAIQTKKKERKTQKIQGPLITLTVTQNKRFYYISWALVLLAEHPQIFISALFKAVFPEQLKC